MTIEPDTKDWTWVLHEPCSECGLAAADVPPAEVAGRVLADVPRWEAVLARPDASDRPAPDTWSPVEYACHVRDAYDVFAARVRLMLGEDDPEFADWDQDAAAVAGDYASQDPAVVAIQLSMEARAVAGTFDAVAADAWEHTGRRDNGSSFTVTTLVQYFLHDHVHHLHDVGA